jgi:hypothetical protein
MAELIMCVDEDWGTREPERWGIGVWLAILFLITLPWWIGLVVVLRALWRATWG